MYKIDLKPATIDDLDNIMTWINDPDVVANIANISGNTTREQEEQWLRGMLASKNDFLYSIFHHDVYIGQAAIHNVYWPAKNGRISVMLKKDFQSRGLGTRAAFVLMDTAFVKHRLNKIWCMILESNPKTLHIYRDKLGMIEEARLVEEYCIGKSYCNVIRLYMLQKYWPLPHNSGR